MFASTSTGTGFGAMRARLRLNGLRNRIDDMTIFYAVAGAILAAILVPAWQASQIATVTPRIVETPRAAAKADRLRGPATGFACDAAAYDGETAECLVASAREAAGAMRVVGSDAGRDG